MRSLLALLAVICPANLQANPSPETSASTLRGFKLNHWSFEEGAPSRINTITQSRDGFLWIGGVEGLFRFDGVTFERIPDRIVVAQLAAARDGAVWVGLARSKGVSVWRKGRLADAKMPHPSREVNDIIEGPDGAIWVARGGRGPLSLARWARGRWAEFDLQSGLPDQPVWDILFARDGTQWLTLEHAVYLRQRGASRFEPAGIVTSPRASLAEGPHGDIWLSDRNGTRRIAANGRIERTGPRFPTNSGTRTLFDRHGDMWGVTWSNAAFRISLATDQRQPSGKVLTLDQSGGLLSDAARAVFEDREGNLWIGGELGLNMVRRVAIADAPVIPEDATTNYMLAVDRDGVVYAANDQAVYRIEPERDPVKAITPGGTIEALCTARDGGVWIVLRGQAIRFRHGRTARFSLPDEFAANSCGEDAGGRLWLPALQKGLFRLEAGHARKWHEHDLATAVPGNVAILPDGRAAIHFRNGTPKLHNPPFVALHDASARSGNIEGLLSGQGTLLLSAATGINAPLLTGSPLLETRAHPWAASLNGLTQTRAGDTWGIGDAGIVRIKSSDLARAFGDPHKAIPYRVFDYRDGLDSFAQKSAGSQIVAGKDGRVWFATRRNLMVIDPKHIPENTLPPEAVIRDLVADKTRIPAMSDRMLPAGTTHVEINFTATSLSIPSRVAFRYRLSGEDNEWIDAGNSRRATFNGLAPGSYTFELLAANEDGVWSRRPVAMRFSIAKAFHQTWWFRLIAGLGAAGLLYLVYALRVRQVGAQIHDRLRERTRERERIARELHDTMIQGVQGLILRFQAVADHFADNPAALSVMLPALDRAEEMLVEGRERVTGLRRTRERDLIEEIRQLSESQSVAQDNVAPITITGTPRLINPDLIDEIVVVLGEAILNAVQHSRATNIEVGVNFGHRQFSAFVRDNGSGIAAEFVGEQGRPGHFGLIGMHERVEAMRGHLRIETAQGFGTEIRLFLPARVIYQDKQIRR